MSAPVVKNNNKKPKRNVNTPEIASDQFTGHILQQNLGHQPPTPDKNHRVRGASPM